MSAPKIQTDPVAAKAIKQAQAQLEKLDAQLAQEKAQLAAEKSKQASTDAKLEAQIKGASGAHKKQLQAQLKKDDASYAKQEKALASKIHEGTGQASALQSKVNGLLKQESAAAARGYHYAPQLVEMASADGKTLAADKQKLADLKKVDAKVTQDLDAKFVAMEKKDPAHKAKYEALRAQLKGQAALHEKPLADKVKADKAAVAELSTELGARGKAVSKAYTKNVADLKKTWAAKLKADAGNAKKVAADKAAEKKALASADLHHKTLLLRGKEAQTAIANAAAGKAVAKWKDVKATPPKPSVPYGEPWSKNNKGQLHGGDTSHYQSKSTFESSIKGSPFAAIKATEGTGYTDPTFKARWNELGDKIKQGKMKLRVAYCFLDKGNGAGQAKHFLDALGIHGKLQPGTRLALDWEASALSSPQTLKDAANYIHKVTGLWPLVYTSASQVSRAKAAVPNAPMWVAQWSGGTSVKNAPFVQYSDGPGYDHDVFNGDLKALERFAGWSK
jgi:GH25 family lysozyme M1 (1,4-beta-N-acetylmuramidase)